MISEELAPTSKPWLVFVSALSFAVILFFSVYFEIQQARYERAIAQMQAKKDEFIAQNKSSNEADRARAVSAKDYLKEIEKKQVIWSKIIEKVESTIPRRADTLEPVVMFRSYNGSSEGRLAVNATTQPNATDPFIDIAFTIKAFASDPTFKNAFVPSIARSLTPDGQTIMTFSMNFEYVPSNLTVRPRVEQSNASTIPPELSTTTATETAPLETITPEVLLKPEPAPATAEVATSTPATPTN